MASSSPYSVPISSKKPIKRSLDTKNPHEPTSRQNPPKQLKGIYQPNGFPTRQAPIKPWIPGVSTPTTRPTVGSPIPKVKDSILYYSDDTFTTDHQNKTKQIYRALASSALSSIVVVIPGVFWLVASKIGYF